MSENIKRRFWMSIKTRAIPIQKNFHPETIGPDDLLPLSRLMDISYQGTIDHDGETPEQCIEEMRGTLTGKYGDFLNSASFGIFENGKALSASMVTLWKGSPLLAFSMTEPSSQGKGMARFLIERSIDALHAQGFAEFNLVVTDGNHSAQKLYQSIGFEQLREAVSENA